MNDNNYMNPDTDNMFRELKYIESRCFGDRTISFGEGEKEDGYIYIDCVSDETQIRLAMPTSNLNHMSILCSVQSDSEEKVAEITSYIEKAMRDEHKDFKEVETFDEAIKLILTTLREIKL